MPVDITTLFPFELDAFQLEAIEAIERDQNLILCAPTGSGKTAVAEYAIAKALAEGRRCFYTTPLKALSNQKFQDFSRRLGEDKVGLLTGDISVRREAPVVVMTTEVYRNMLYGTNLGDVGKNLAGVQSVILDECHYMNDAERGTVWEESIIYSPRQIQLIGLSATVANAEELAAWISTIHRQTHLVKTDFRPVPLRHFYFHRDVLYRLLTSEGRVNPKLFRLQDQRGKRKRKGNRSSGAKPSADAVVSSLSRKEMLPAIYFVFSRKGCERALLESIGSLKLPKSVRTTLRQKIAEALESHPSFERHPHLSALYQGLAVHHAGVLPAWKSLVENLFCQGLIQVVFATETLAAGINMPARTTVIQAVSKYSGDGHRLLTGSEFLQMSGRAGRRGMDEVGNVVICHHPAEKVAPAVALAQACAEPLESNFRPSYGMVLNLLQRHSLEQARRLVEKSFGQFLADQQLETSQGEVGQLRRELERLSAPLCPGPLGDLKAYRKLRERYRTCLKQTRALAAGADPAVVTERERLGQLRVQLRNEFQASPCHQCPVQDPCRRQGRERRQVSRDLRLLERQGWGTEVPYWEQFQRLVSVLTEARYLEDEKPTEVGEMAAQFRATNVLFLAEVVCSGLLDKLRPAELAGVITALITEDSRRVDQADRPPLSRAAAEAIHRLELLAEQVFDLQERHFVEVPLELNGGLAGLTEGWARGGEWEGLERSTGLAAGDIIRVLRRTLDVCRQFGYSRGVPERVSELCRQAERRIARDEVKESLTFLTLTGPTEEVVGSEENPV